MLDLALENRGGIEYLKFLREKDKVERGMLRMSTVAGRIARWTSWTSNFITTTKLFRTPLRMITLGKIDNLIWFLLVWFNWSLVWGCDGKVKWNHPHRMERATRPLPTNKMPSTNFSRTNQPYASGSMGRSSSLLALKQRHLASSTDDPVSKGIMDATSLPPERPEIGEERTHADALTPNSRRRRRHYHSVDYCRQAFRVSAVETRVLCRRWCKTCLAWPARIYRFHHHHHHHHHHSHYAHRRGRSTKQLPQYRHLIAAAKCFERSSSAATRPISGRIKSLIAIWAKRRALRSHRHPYHHPPLW
ncbi:hypothetical protein IWX47DRAFT_33917 [Phyllosticta citricarpa]|uniref:Uncharacterized protein n=1 Tax=Phyllosticta citricarpa TaxID=55181 RepID=A0ABR1LH20_9PEZI